MALTPAVILSVLNIRQNFTLLNTSAPYNTETIQDATNWASINISSGAGDTVKCIYQIVDPTGSIIYQNTNYSAGTFGSPDTTLTSLTSSAKTLNVFTGTTIPVTGVYTVNVKVQVTPNGQSAVEIQSSFTCNLQADFAPQVPQTTGPQPVGGNTQNYPPIMVLTLQETPNCAQATYTSTDVTTYSAPAGWSINTITRTHTTTPPQGSKKSDGTTDQPAVTGSAQQNYLAAPDNPLWTGAYQSSLAVTMSFTDAHGNTCSIQGIVYADNLVVCDNNYCKLECVMDDLMQDLTEAIAVGDSVMVQKLERRVNLGTIMFQRIIQANLCGNTVKAQQYTDLFYKFTGGGSCNCNHCNSTAPAPVIPTSSTTGPQGPAGPAGPQGPAGPTGPQGTSGAILLWNVLDQPSTTATIFTPLSTYTLLADTMSDHDMLRIHILVQYQPASPRPSDDPQIRISFGGTNLWVNSSPSEITLTPPPTDLMDIMVLLSRTSSSQGDYTMVLTPAQDVSGANTLYQATTQATQPVFTVFADFTTNLALLVSGKSVTGGTLVLQQFQVEYLKKT